MANDVTSLTKSLDRIADALEGQSSGGSGGGGVFNVNCSVEQITQSVTTYTLDKTWKEINDAFMAGVTVIVKQIIPMQGEGSETIFDSVFTVGTGKEENVSEEGTFNYYYFVCFGSGYNTLSLMAVSENDYPSYTRT